MKKAVDLLIKNNTNFRFNASITPQNAHELKAIIDYGKSVDSPVRVTTYMFPPVRRLDDCFGRNNRLTPEEAGRLKVLTEYYQLESADFVDTAVKFEKFVPIKDLDFSKTDGQGARMRCLAGKCSAWVDWQGNVSACGMTAVPKIALNGYTLADAWEECRRFADNKPCCSVCEACPNRRYCVTCMSIVYNETGTFDERHEYMCRMMQSAADNYRALAATVNKDESLMSNSGKSVSKGKLSSDCLMDEECDFEE